MRRSMTMTAALLLLAGCGASVDKSANPATPEVVVQAQRPAAAEPAELTDLPEAASDALETEHIADLRYHPGYGPFEKESGAVDVIAPTSGGPWPTVVVFHGDPRSASKEWHLSDAQLIAEQGRVVFLPAWGQVESAALAESGTRAWWDLLTEELACAVAFAHANAEQFGGDPEHITLYGLSAGGNAVLMAGLADAEPLDNCTAAGPAIRPQALVPIDADWVLGGSWDADISEDPETFYALTPWRYLDGSQDLRIHVVVTENPGPYLVRSVQPDPTTSWLSYRHADIDLVADLEERGFLADDMFGLKESGEYGYQVLLEAGYEVSLVVAPGASHTNWGEDGTAVIVQTVLNAEQ